jgi:hypothetical protein
MHLGKCYLKKAIEERVHGLRSDTLRKGSRVRQVTEQDGDVLAFPLQSASRGQNFLGKVFGGIGQGFACVVCGWSRGECWGFRDRERRCCWSLLTSPHETSPLVVSHWMHVKEFILQVVEVVVIEVKASFQRTIGHTSLAFEEVDDLGENVIEGHG